MDVDLPFAAEYAESGRACTKCKQSVADDTLCMAIMFHSRKFDRKFPSWYHWECFLEKKPKLQKISEIANFDNLCWKDQERIKKILAAGRSDNDDGAVTSIEDCFKNSYFSVQYARSGMFACVSCACAISKGDVRISVMDNDPENHGLLWRHVDCFAKDKQLLGFDYSTEELLGFNLLKYQDQEMVKEKIGSKGVKRKLQDDRSPSNGRVMKTNHKGERNFNKEEKILKEQNQLLFDMRDKIAKSFSKEDMIRLLEHNEQHISTGNQKLLDHLADCLVFGAFEKCPECKRDTPFFMNNTYVCNENLTEWTKCPYKAKYPERKIFLIPEIFREDYPFLKGYKCFVKDRKFHEIDEASTVEASTSKKNLLNGLKICLIGKFETPQHVIEEELQELRAKIHKKINKHTNLCLSRHAKIKKARILDIHVVSYGFVEAIKKGLPVSSSIKDNLLSTWGVDPILKFGIKKEDDDQRKSGVEKGKTLTSIPKKVRVAVKGDVEVDPKSGLQQSYRVYQNKDGVYNAVLAYVNISKGTNLFHKLQILESNLESKYCLFEHWGRVGTAMGGQNVKYYSIAVEAISSFEALYLEKTGNEWLDRQNFVKKPDRMYPLDIDYGEECEQMQKLLKPGQNSKLPKPVQELVCLIFDVENMKKTILGFEIDLGKMPLGKLSRKQVGMAYKVLGEAQQILLTGYNSAKTADVTNRFFTLIPHDFGMKVPPLLDNDTIIKSKIEMLDSLMEIDFAFKLITREYNESKDLVDVHYEKLKTDIVPLPKDSWEFKLVEKYMKNTQYYGAYNLKLQEVFKISRHGESENYKNFKNLHNKKLLWHGSRLANYAGILSQGLRIAPPEALNTGHMFGKGVYFADMVSKSANYCYFSNLNSSGLLLLCEVALGNMLELTNGVFITTLPVGKHSAFGMGMVVPDPNHKTFIKDVEVPYGKPISRTGIQCRLRHNEYVVYDTNQINIKYLLQVNFQYSPIIR